jgi:hypothetical protein
MKDKPMSETQDECSPGSHCYAVESLEKLGFVKQDGTEWYVLRPPDSVRFLRHHRLRHSQIAWRPDCDVWQVNGLGAAGPQGKTIEDVEKLIQMILG